jgi:hypothetical protein
MTITIVGGGIAGLTDAAAARLERLLDASYVDWRQRETWRRRQVMDGRSGAIDHPGTTWRDRPAIDRGDGVFVAGDMMAAPGSQSEIAWASAVQAAALAVAADAGVRTPLDVRPDTSAESIAADSRALYPSYGGKAYKSEGF